MFKLVSNTIVFKLLTSAVNFAIVIITSRFLGAEGKGITSLFIANITVILLVSNLIGGTGLTYLSSRKKMKYLIFPVYLWGVISCIAISLFLQLAGEIPTGLFWHLMALSILQMLFSANTSVLLGIEKIPFYNILLFGQTLLLGISLLIFFPLLQSGSVLQFIHALYISYGLAALFSFYAFYFIPKSQDSTSFVSTIKELWRIGFKGQFSNIIQFFNYRLNYYLIFLILGKSQLGIFSIGVALAEAVWIIGKSLAMILYSQFANRKDEEYAKGLAFRFARISFLLTFFITLILSLIPSEIYAFIFGNAFSSSKIALLGLMPGILSISATVIFSHFFAGKAKYEINNYAALFGFAALLMSGYPLIRYFGIFGAAMSMSLSYLSSSVYFYFKFSKETGFVLSNLLPQKDDRKTLLVLLQSLKKPS